MAVRLFVGNLPYDVTEAELRAHFAAVGPLASLSLATDRDTGKPPPPSADRNTPSISARPDRYVSAPETTMVTRRRGTALMVRGDAPTQASMTLRSGPASVPDHGMQHRGEDHDGEKSASDLSKT